MVNHGQPGPPVMFKGLINSQPLFRETNGKTSGGRDGSRGEVGLRADFLLLGWRNRRGNSCHAFVGKKH